MFVFKFGSRFSFKFLFGANVNPEPRTPEPNLNTNREVRTQKCERQCPSQFVFVTVFIASMNVLQGTGLPCTGATVATLSFIRCT